MLDLGGVPLFAKDRSREHPLILAAAPAPTTRSRWRLLRRLRRRRGEEVVHEISDVVREWKRSAGSREDLHWLLAEVPGVYVPSLFRIHYHSDSKLIAAIEPIKPATRRWCGGWCPT